MSTIAVETLDVVGSAALGVFALVSFYDGIWVHLVRLRLFALPASRHEHLVHTGRALLFPVLLVTLFSPGSERLPRLVAWCALAADQLLEVVDMAIEHASRSSIGGLSSDEYLVHGTLITLRTVAVGAALLVYPAGTGTSGSLDALSGWLLPGALLAAAVHVVLAAQPTLPRTLRASVVAARR